MWWKKRYITQSCLESIKYFRLKPTKTWHHTRRDPLGDLWHKGNSTTSRSGQAEPQKTQSEEILILEQFCCMLHAKVSVWVKELHVELLEAYLEAGQETMTFFRETKLKCTGSSCVLFQIQVKLIQDREGSEQVKSHPSPFFVTLGRNTHQARM